MNTNKPTSKYLKHPSPTGTSYEYEVRHVSFPDWEKMDVKTYLDMVGDGGWQLTTRTAVKMGDGEVWELIFMREKK